MAQMTRTLQESLKTIVALQQYWSADNTQPMQKRGQLIRDEIPSLLRTLAQQHCMEVEGRDGTGRKTRVPWVRVYDPELSPSATQGWYVVYLFAADGSTVYLSLNQGTTVFTGGQFVARDPEELAQRVTAARSQLGPGF